MKLDLNAYLGCRVFSEQGRSGKLKKLGRLRAFLFHVDSLGGADSHAGGSGARNATAGLTCVAIRVKRPDVAWMFARADAVIPFSACTFESGDALVHASSGQKAHLVGRQAPDPSGVVRLLGADVVAEDGTSLGAVADACVNADDGRVVSFTVSEGALADALLGSAQIAAAHILRVRHVAGTGVQLVVARSGADAGREVGLAEKAGKASVAAAQTIGRCADSAGKQVKQQVERSKTMFKDFADAFKKEYNDN